MHPNVLCSTVYNNQDMEETTDRWKDKEDMVCVWICAYIHKYEYHSAIKKNEIMPFAATWMDLEISILSEVSQTDKHK